VEWVDRGLSLSGVDAYPALRVRALITKSGGMWNVGRRSERPAVVATMEAVARRLGDPVILSQALQHRVAHEIDGERLDVADAVADEALHWARAAGDAWEIAAASRVKAMSAQSIADLRERVDMAASLLTDAGNIRGLASLLNTAAYVALCLGSEHDATESVARARPLLRALDSQFEWMIYSGNAGLAALLSGEIDTATHAFREELRLCREMVVRPVVFEGLCGLAAVAVVNGDDNRAARLVGAADAHRYDTVPNPVEARLDATFFEPARSRCGTRTWDAAAGDGRTLSFDNAIAYALDQQSPQPANAAS